MKLRKWSDSIDPGSIPDAVLKSERGRRNAAKRVTRTAGPGRPRTMRSCSKCHAVLSATAMRGHKCEVTK